MHRVIPAATHGFTLIEIMVVVAILGVLAAIGVPIVTRSIERRAATIEVEKVRAEIEKARDNARTKLRCVKVTRSSSSMLRFDEMTAASTGCGATIAATSYKQFQTRIVDITSNIDITFNRNGAVNGATADTLDVVVSAKTGGATIPSTFRIFTIVGLLRRV